MLARCMLRMKYVRRCAPETGSAGHHVTATHTYVRAARRAGTSNDPSNGKTLVHFQSDKTKEVRIFLFFWKDKIRIFLMIFV